MNPLTEGIFAAALCVSVYAIHDIEDAANRQASALQQIANQARDQSRTLDGIREDNREVLEHTAGAAKRGTICRGLGDASPTDGYMPWCKPAHVEAKRGTAK